MNYGHRLLKSFHLFFIVGFLFWACRVDDVPDDSQRIVNIRNANDSLVTYYDSVLVTMLDKESRPIDTLFRGPLASTENLIGLKVVDIGENFQIRIQTFKDDGPGPATLIAFAEGTPPEVTIAPPMGSIHPSQSDSVITSPDTATADTSGIPTAPKETISLVGITVLSDSHGAISPQKSGRLEIPKGGSQEFHFLADVGYHIREVKIDDVPMDSARQTGTYVFTNIQKAHTLAVLFDINAYSLTTPLIGKGSILREPNDSIYAHGTKVKLTAKPEAGHDFSGWSGDTSSTEIGLSLSMDKSKNIKAQFNPIGTFTLNLTDSNGSIIKEPNLAAYLSGSDVKLTAVPDSGYWFSGWSEDVKDTARMITVRLTGNKTIKAGFEKITHTITATAGPNGTITPKGAVSVDQGKSQVFLLKAEPGYHITQVLIDGVADNAAKESDKYTFTQIGKSQSISVSFGLNTYSLLISGVNGSVSKMPDQLGYAHGSRVKLKAIPNEGHQFQGWSGDAKGIEDTVTISMETNKAVTANFSKIGNYTINLTASHGSVKKSPLQDYYEFGSLVTLTASADSNYKFTGWTGDTLSSVNPITIVVSKSKNLTAQFAAITHTLTLSTDGNGSTTPSGTQIVAQGVPTDISATPNSGYSFLNWSVTVGSAKIDNVNLPSTRATLNSAPATLRANFARKTYTLEIMATSGGGITRTPENANYKHGDTVTLQAVSLASHTFSGWSGPDGFGNTNPLKLVMDGNKSISGNFIKKTFTLSVTAANGAVEISPLKSLYSYGDLVQLTANPNENYTFGGWSGAGFSGSVNPATLTMDGNKSVTATFIVKPPSNLTYSQPNAIYLAETDIVPNNPTYNGGPATLFTITPRLPEGLIFNSQTGVITGKPGGYGDSDTVYTITAINSTGEASTTIRIQIKSIILTYPNGGESFKVGETINIKWKNSTFVTAIQIHVSVDNGKTWPYVTCISAIFDDDPNWQNWPWKIPPSLCGGGNLVSTSVLMRIHDIFEYSFRDHSDNPFTLNP